MRFSKAIVGCVVAVTMGGCIGAGAPEEESAATSEDALTTSPAKLQVLAGTAPLKAVQIAEDTARVAHASFVDTMTAAERGTALTSSMQQKLQTQTRAFFDAELDVERVLRAAWTRAIPTNRDADASLALQLAALETETLLRRQLGPTFHTAVPGLASSRACAGGIVHGHLVGAAGKVLTGHASATAEADALRRVATQIACLGARQLRLLDLALSIAVAGVEGRLASRKLDALVAGYQRLMAPIMLLVLDATKHYGATSYSGTWLRLRQSTLTATIGQRGWSPSRTIFVYNRRAGDLMGFGECATVASLCVDPRKLIESLLDPRAVGLGGCGLDAMISKGPVTTSLGQSRYTCPSLECGAETVGGVALSETKKPSTGGGLVSPSDVRMDAAVRPPAERAGLAAFRAAWPGEAGATDESLRRDLCLPNGAVAHLTAANIQSCLSDLVTRGTSSPYDDYVACVADSVTTPGAKLFADSFGGVPAGRGCQLSDGGSTQTSTQEPAKTPAPATSPGVGELVLSFIQNTWAELVRGVASATEGFATRVGAGGASAVAGAGVGIATQLLSDQGAGAVGGIGSLASVIAANRAFGKGEVNEEALLIPHGVGTSTDKVNAINRARRSGQSCIDASQCGDGCTGLSKQLKKASACSEKLVNESLRRLGVPTPETPPKRDLSPVQNWAPDAVSVGGDPTGACLATTTPSPNATDACGMVLCASSSLASSAASTGSTCCGGRVPVSAVSSASACYATNCGGLQTVVNPVTGQCECEQPVSPPGAPPGPPTLPPTWL